MRTELVTTLKREATKVLQRIRDEKEPLLITEHGKPAAYLVDVESFEANQKRMNLLEGIARGEQAIAGGRVYSNEQAKSKFSKWLK
jgi:prevent-host-death family protein|tara:strand:- start:440 stop:697 length:258 start_codon:yes stop_codon:yes gene_type:complete